MAGSKITDWVEEQTQLNGKPAYRVLIPEYNETSCCFVIGEPRGWIDITGKSPICAFPLI